MLERATACLKAGAKDSIKCAHQSSHAPASRSKRMLHQSFWTNAAVDLDLPLLALPTSNASSHLPSARYDSHSPGRGEELASSQTPHRNEHPFLEFLYPPQALAWLQRTSGQQHSERWQRRNARRLPDGFTQASRGYASQSYAPITSAAGADTGQKHTSQRRDDHEPIDPHTVDSAIDRNLHSANEHMEGDGEDNFSSHNSVDGYKDDTALARAEQDAASSEGTANLVKGQNLSANFTRHPAAPNTTSSTMEAVDPDPLYDLRSLLSKPRRHREDSTAHAWTLYNVLEDSDRQDIRLKTELLLFFAAGQNPIADAHCISLYMSLPLNARSLSTYQAALAAFLRREDKESAIGLHKEALLNLPNSNNITKTLFIYALQNGLVATAVRVKEQHNAALPNQDAIFWLNVSDLPDLMTLAFRFANKSLQKERAFKKSATKPNVSSLLGLSARVSEEALNQLVQNPLPSLRDLQQSDLPSQVYQLCNTIYQWHSVEAPRIFEANMIRLLQRHGIEGDAGQPRSRAEFGKIYHIVSYMYRLCRKSSDFKPSQRLLTLLLVQLLNDSETTKRTRKGSRSVNLKTIVRDWKLAHGKLSSFAVRKLMEFHASKGEVERLAQTFEYLLQSYPAFDEQKPALWTLLDVHARRGDVDSAIRAFGEMRRLTIANNDTVDAKWWTMLTWAHFHADDLEGAFVTFRRMLDSGVTPMPDTVTPMLRMLAGRADVGAVQDLLEQYDKLSTQPRDTTMLSCLLLALVRNGRMHDAEAALRSAIADVRASRVVGSLTRCFDVLMQANAQKKELDKILHLFSWMKAEKISLSSKTYVALMQALCNHRQTHDAWRILRVALPRAGIDATAHHFSVIMEGYNSQGLYQRALQVYKKMLSRGVQANLRAKRAYLTARAYQEQRLRARSSHNRDVNGKPVPLANVQEEVKRAVYQLDGSELAKARQTLSGKDVSITEASELLTPIMLLQGKRRQYEAVEELYKIYKDKAVDLGKPSGMVPIRTLGALMSAAMYAGRYDEVEKYWKVAKDEADMFAAPVAVPDFRQDTVRASQDKIAEMSHLDVSGEAATLASDGAEIGFAARQASLQGAQTLLPKTPAQLGPRPVPGRRLILSTVVRYYFRALLAQNRMADMVMTWTRLLEQGYLFDNRAWNRFVEYLCASSPPLTLFAFSITERYLIPNFPGWSRGVQWGASKAARAENLQHMRARHIDQQSVLMPQYRTMQHLAAALLKTQRSEASGHMRWPQSLRRLIGSVEQIRRQAPETLRHVENMPRVDDYWQERLLRRQSDAYNLGTRPYSV